MKTATLNQLVLYPACLFTLWCGFGCATPPKSSSIAANPADVDTIPHLMRASYETVSGPAGAKEQVRQIARDTTFYMPGAMFVSVFEEKGQMKSKILSEKAYWDGFDSSKPAYETEAGRRTERYGNVAQVRSVSVLRSSSDGPITERYVNYCDLYWDGKRWWIAGMVWQKESPSMPIPDSWLGSWEEVTR
jgi:hypothetical protein